jgi:hypothetical protein
LVEGPDHFVFLPEDKSVHSRRSRWANSTRLPAQALIGAAVRFAAWVETVFVLRAQRGAAGGVEFKEQAACDQRYNTKRYIYHGSTVATAMPPERSL